jgi:pyruvate formate lyase activating enzyme
MMSTGVVFDVREFTIHDGPGIRTTIFLKGCPLTCMWCHNPEGQSMQPQIIRSPAGERMAGQEFTSVQLAALLNQQADILNANEGGVTFSGGEPLFQAEFVAEVIDQLHGLHILLDTSGYGEEEDFRKLVSRSNLIFFDLKLMDPGLHRYYTGCNNDLILNNLDLLSSSSKPFIIRVPLVPGVTDTNENLSAIAQKARGLSGLLQVDLLPYNRSAGSKYRYAGLEFKPEYDETGPLNIPVALFQELGLKVCIR